MSTEAGHNSGVAEDLVREAYRRWSALEDRKAEIAEDLKELAKEWKGDGLDTKAMRAAFRRKRKMEAEPDVVQEEETMVELYLACLTRDPRVRTREIIDEFPAAAVEIDLPQGVYMSVGDGWTEHLPAHDPETGEITEQESREEGVGPDAPSEACDEAAIGVPTAETAPVANSGTPFERIKAGLEDAVAIAKGEKAPAYVFDPDPEIPAFLDRRTKSAGGAA